MAEIARKHRRSARMARKHQSYSWLRIGTFGTIVVAVLAAIAYLLAPVLEPKASGITRDGSTRIINLQVAMDGFDIKQIRAKVGENIKVNVRSMDNALHTDGGGKHQFAIDELGVNIIAQPQSVNSGSFTPTKPGTYAYYCDICCGGKANPTMVGTLIVEA